MSVKKRKRNPLSEEAEEKGGYPDRMQPSVPDLQGVGTKMYAGDVGYG